MQVEIRIDGAYPEPKVVILTAAVTEEVSQLAKKLSGDAPCILSGMKDGKVEQRLNPHQFVRISNSEIINLKKIDYFDLSFTGTICVKLRGGTVTYISRRYVSKVKTILGI